MGVQISTDTSNRTEPTIAVRNLQLNRFHLLQASRCVGQFVNGDGILRILKDFASRLVSIDTIQVDGVGVVRKIVGLRAAVSDDVESIGTIFNAVVPSAGKATSNNTIRSSTTGVINIKHKICRLWRTAVPVFDACAPDISDLIVEQINFCDSVVFLQGHPSAITQDCHTLRFNRLHHTGTFNQRARLVMLGILNDVNAAREISVVVISDVVLLIKSIIREAIILSIFIQHAARESIAGVRRHITGDLHNPVVGIGANALEVETDVGEFKMIKVKAIFAEVEAAGIHPAAGVNDRDRAFSIEVRRADRLTFIGHHQQGASVIELEVIRQRANLHGICGVVGVAEIRSRAAQTQEGNLTV